MNTCTSNEGSCILGRNWVCFWFEVPGYDSRPVKTPPIGPWWEDGHGLGFVLVMAYIPLKDTTQEEAESLLKKYWPSARSIQSRVNDRVWYNCVRDRPSWWRDTGDSCQKELQ
jgi:hypothetical protein